MNLQAEQDMMRARALERELRGRRAKRQRHEEDIKRRNRENYLTRKEAQSDEVDEEEEMGPLPEVPPRAKVRGKKKREFGKVVCLGMPKGDPLYEMLPSEDRLSTMKWVPRPVYQMPPSLRSQGIVDPVKTSCSRMVQLFLLDERQSQCDRQGRNRFLQLLLKLHETAMSGKGPYSVSAANILLERGFGKIKPSDEEVDMNRNKGMNVVYVSKIENNIPIHEETPAMLPQPEFLEGEIVPQPASEEFGARE